MSFDLALRYGTLLSLLIAAVSVGFAVVSHRRQVNATIYLDLTNRLYKLYRSLPDELRAAQLEGREADEAHRRLAAIIVVDFLHLMNAAFTLYKTGYFSGKLWKAIRAEARRGLQLPIFVEEWPRTKSEFIYDTDFIKYVEKTQRAARPQKKA